MKYNLIVEEAINSTLPVSVFSAVSGNSRHYQITFFIRRAKHMPALNARPQFGGKLNIESYYRDVSAIIAILRPMSSLRVIANHLNGQGFKTPSGLNFNRDRLANFISSQSRTSN
jgi:hypothetical protein